MHRFRTLILTTFLSLVFCFSSNAQGKNYKGYRIFISNIKILKKTKSKVSFTADVHNTGSETVRLGRNRSMSIITNVEETFSEGIHDYIEDAIVEKILKSDNQVKKSGSFSIKEKIKIDKKIKSTHLERLDMDEKRFLLNRQVDKDICPDLAFDTIFIKERRKKTMIIGYQLTNNGKGAASIFGRKAHLFDNISIKAFFSGSTKLSRGATEIGNFYISDGLEKTKGILFPGETYNGEIQVSLYKHSRYTNVLILKVDGTQVLIECLEGNNVRHLLL